MLLSTPIDLVMTMDHLNFHPLSFYLCTLNANSVETPLPPISASFYSRAMKKLWVPWKCFSTATESLYICCRLVPQYKKFIWECDSRLHGWGMGEWRGEKDSNTFKHSDFWVFDPMGQLKTLWISKSGPPSGGKRNSSLSSHCPFVVNNCHREGH
jgi:hypothetical protein